MKQILERINKYPQFECLKMYASQSVEKKVLSYETQPLFIGG